MCNCFRCFWPKETGKWNLHDLWGHASRSVWHRIKRSATHTKTLATAVSHEVANAGTQPVDDVGGRLPEHPGWHRRH